MSARKFTAVLKKMGSWTIAQAPFDTFKVFGTRRAVRIKGTIDGFPIGGISLMPMGDGTHFITVRAELRKEINKQVGDKVLIIVEKDESEDVVPPELIEALEASEEGKQMFYAQSPSNRRFMIRHINGSKRSETREKRAAEITIRMERDFFEKGLPKKKRK